MFAHFHLHAVLEIAALVAAGVILAWRQLVLLRARTEHLELLLKRARCAGAQARR
jgi:hypothetical protein